MQTVTIEQIDKKLRQLPEEKLTAVYYFVSYLSETGLDMSDVSSYELLLSTSDLIEKEWNTPEEDEAWASL